jgi:hypothetical protein
MTPKEKEVLVAVVGVVVSVTGLVLALQKG